MRSKKNGSSRGPAKTFTPPVPEVTSPVFARPRINRVADANGRLMVPPLAIVSALRTGAAGPWTVTDWVATCVVEKTPWMTRSS